MDRCYFCRRRVTARKVDYLHRWGEAMLLCWSRVFPLRCTRSARKSQRLVNSHGEVVVLRTVDGDGAAKRVRRRSTVS